MINQTPQLKTPARITKQNPVASESDLEQLELGWVLLIGA